jgi:hypothetical protein
MGKKKGIFKGATSVHNVSMMEVDKFKRPRNDLLRDN